MLKIEERIDNKFPFRVYKMSNGEFFPSVTTITGLIHEDEILKWKQRVGELESMRISEESSSHGTRFHELMEDYLNGKVKNVEFMSEFYSVFHILKKNIFPRITEVKGIEKQLSSEKLKTAGTADLIANWDNELSIIDWKTSKRYKDKKDVVNYFAQLSAYAFMLKENFGLEVKNLVLVFNVSDSEVYFLKESNLNKWLKVFLSCRKEFYRRNKI